CERAERPEGCVHRRASKESAQEARGFVGDGDDLVGGLAIELEVQLGLGPPIVPIAERLQLKPSQAALRERLAPDRDAHARRLPGNAALPRERPCRRDNAARDQAVPALVLA